MNDSNGQPLCLGSGFFVSTGIIATNAHVIEGASSGTAKLIGDDRTMQILGTVAIDRHSDLALLKVNSPAPPLVLGLSASPTVGDNVYVVGSPLGLEGTFSEGIVSGIRRIEADSVLQMTAPISPGSSGGPVMDGSGAVIGIAVATFKNGQNLNLAVPVSYLSKLLAPPAKEVVPLAERKKSDPSSTSMLDGVGTKAENGVIVSDFHLEIGIYEYGGGGYEFRLTNKLPVAISYPHLIILYYDAAGSLMDFEEYTYDGYVPAGLTKTIVSEFGSKESKRAAGYYRSSTHAIPNVELRVIRFHAEEQN